MGKKKNVIFLSYRPSYGGVTTFQCNYIQYLCNICNVTYVDEHVNITKKQLDKDCLKKIKMIKMSVWTKPFYSSLLLFKKLRKIKPNLIVINNHGLLTKHLLVLIWFKFYYKTDIIIVNHSTMLTFKKSRKLLEIIGSFTIFIANKVVYVSEFTKYSWGNTYPWVKLKKSKVVYNGIYIPKDNKQLKTLQLKNTIGFVGRISKEKNVKIFCEIAKFASELKLPMRFIAFGDNQNISEIGLAEQMIDAIEWFGRSDRKEDIYKKIDLLLMVSPIENCPFAVIESKRYGVPTISFQVGGLPEIIHHKVDGILAKDVKEMIDGIFNIYKNYFYYSNNCLFNSNEFDINKTGPQIFGEYLS